MPSIKDLMGAGIPALPATLLGEQLPLMVISPSPKHQLALLLTVRMLQIVID